MKTVIEMSREAGAYIADLPLEDAVLFEVDILSGRSAKLEAFAELVRADEREACAKVCENNVSLKPQYHWWSDVCRTLASAIRARGNK